MKVSARGREFIAAHEGIRTKAYRDSVGVWTIGIGHTASAGPPTPKAGMVISRAEVMEIFARDLGKFEARVSKALGPVPQHVFDGAVSFDFNTGGIHKATWVKKYRAGDMAGARTSFMAWNKPPEIIGRRRDERDLIFHADYGDHGPLTPSTKPSETIREGQRLLTALGYSPGPVDGLDGPKTRSAVRVFQDRSGLKVDGIIGPKTLAALRAAIPPPPDIPKPEPKPPVAPIADGSTGNPFVDAVLYLAFGSFVAFVVFKVMGVF